MPNRLRQIAHLNFGFRVKSDVLPVAIIVAVGVVIFMGKPNLGPNSKARKSAAKLDMSQFSDALREFQRDRGRYPTTAEGLEALIRPRHYLEMDRIPDDPWDHPYQYKCPGQHNTNSYDLIFIPWESKERSGRQ